MKKKNIITALLVLVALTGQSQEVKMNEPSFDDYLLLLEQKGYMARSFDFSMFEGKKARLSSRSMSTVKRHATVCPISLI